MVIMSSLMVNTSNGYGQPIYSNTTVMVIVKIKNYIECFNSLNTL